MSRLKPLPPGTTPELAEYFGAFQNTLGFVPNSMLIMQRKPGIVKGIATLNKLVMDPATSEVHVGFKRLIGYVSSKAAGCRYCQAHTIHGARRWGIDEDKLKAVWEYRTSPLYTEGERAAIDFALAASAQPNDVTDAHFTEMRKHWSEAQIVEILAVVAMFGFLNRWNDSMGTPLEPAAVEAGEAYLGGTGWDVGKHAGG